MEGANFTGVKRANINLLLNNIYLKQLKDNLHYIYVS